MGGVTARGWSVGRRRRGDQGGSVSGRVFEGMDPPPHPFLPYQRSKLEQKLTTALHLVHGLGDARDRTRFYNGSLVSSLHCSHLPLRSEPLIVSQSRRPSFSFSFIVIIG